MNEAKKYATLSDLFDETTLYEFLNDPNTLISFVAPYDVPDSDLRREDRMYKIIVFLIYYYKWIYNGNDNFAPNDMYLERFKGITKNDISIMLDRITRETINKAFRSVLIANFAMDIPQLSNEEDINNVNNMWNQFLEKHNVPSEIYYKYVSFLPPLIRENYLDRESFCKRCSEIVDNPKRQKRYVDLYFKFKLWGVQIYNEHHYPVSLDELCRENMDGYCPKEMREQAMKLRMERGFGSGYMDNSISIPNEISHHIASFM